VLDAVERATPRAPDVPPDRIEHLQLLRPQDRSRLAGRDVTASLQPIHCAADRAMVDACWVGREGLAYPWRSLQAAGARLAFGSDAPIESANPWLGIFAAVHRRHPGDGTPDWQPGEAIDVASALGAYTHGAAVSGGHPDEGHLRVGAQADLAILNVDRATLLRSGDALAEVRSDLTLVAGREVHRS
jgi:predicted amidohydrolase YtcJ